MPLSVVIFINGVQLLDTGKWKLKSALVLCSEATANSASQKPIIFLSEAANEERTPDFQPPRTEKALRAKMFAPAAR